MVRKKPDKALFIIIWIIIFFGLLVFSSASIGYIASGDEFARILGKQLISFAIGIPLLFIGLVVPLSFWRKYSLLIFFLSIIATLLVFIPKIGASAGGASRWLEIGPLTAQPAEFLKFGAILYTAAFFSNVREKITNIKYGLMPLVLILGVLGVILLAQPNTGIFVVIALASVGMFVVAGGKWRHVFILVIIALIGLFILAETRPYVKERITTYISFDKADQQAEGYQIEQSLRAIGAGGVFGRGFGQSIQKFGYLPEPIGDSIFAVLAEEFGFIGGILLIILFLLFTLAGLVTSARASTHFSRLVAVGIVILIAGESFLNIGAMLGLFPLSGIPILFVSQGGTAVVFALLEVGVLLNISRK
jgi:cell division protein FtsW